MPGKNRPVKGEIKMTVTTGAPKASVRRSRRRRPRLTERDQEILALLGRYGCVSAKRIKTYFWRSTRNSRAHYRRMGMLKRRGLVENVAGDSDLTIGYRLTKNGKRALAKWNVDQRRPLLRRSYKTQFEHDQLLIDIRRILEKSPIVREFKTETELLPLLIDGKDRLRNREERITVPDASFVLAVPGRELRVAVELELSSKQKKRYAKLFRGHLLAKPWQLVIYIVRDRNMQARLMKNLEEVKTTDIHVRIAKIVNGIYFCTLEEFLAKELAVPLANGKKEISLAQIAQSVAAQP